MCGVSTTPATFRRGCSAGSGSCSKTSSAAPPSLPLSTKRATAASSTTPPRAAFTRYAPGFMAASCASPSMPRVDSVSGTCSETTSPRRSTSSSVPSSMSSPEAFSSVRNGSKATTRMPNARARFATSLPMRPAPTSPSVLPYSSVPWNDLRSHSPAFMEWSAAGTCRTSASTSAKASSAAEMVLPLGAFSTATPRSVAASRSMLSTPTPASSGARTST